MRKLTSHIVDGDAAPQLTIEVLDEPSHGGAHHKYLIHDHDLVFDPAFPKGSDMNDCLIEFQNGPIKEFGINGITNEALIAIVIDRLESFQGGPFASSLNQRALDSLKDGLISLKARTVERIMRGVQGTNQK